MVGMAAATSAAVDDRARRWEWKARMVDALLACAERTMYIEGKKNRKYTPAVLRQQFRTAAWFYIQTLAKPCEVLWTCPTYYGGYDCYIRQDSGLGLKYSVKVGLGTWG